MVEKLNQETKAAIIINIKNESKPDKYFFIMVLLSCIIATYGLLSNSVAVIIGAMLIAPLMYPILNGALSLTLSSHKLMRSAVIAELAGVAIAIVCAVILTLLLPVSDITNEIIIRTKPTLLDLAIAIASGFAGTVAICYRPSSAILPGVAIASALMPPLCVIGIGLAKHDFNIAGGATLLFLSNIIAINVAGIIVFELVGFGQKYISLEDENNPKALILKKFVYPGFLLLLITIPLVYFMNQSFANTNIENKINKTLKDGIMLIDTGNEVVSMNFKTINNKIIVNTTIRSVKSLLPSEIRQFENKLEYELGSPVGITAEVVPIAKVTATGTSKTDDKSEKRTVEFASKSLSVDNVIEKIINEKLNLIPNSKLIDYSFKYHNSTSTYNIYITIKSEQALDKNFEDSIKSKVENSLSRKVIIHIKEDIK